MLRVVDGDGTVWEQPGAVADLEAEILDELEAADDECPPGTSPLARARRLRFLDGLA